MSKKLWNKCECGIITDSDEKKCPMQGLESDSKHQLKPVELSDKELRKLIKSRKVYTKYHSRLEEKDPP